MFLLFPLPSFSLYPSREWKKLEKKVTPTDTRSFYQALSYASRPAPVIYPTMDDRIIDWKKRVLTFSVFSSLSFYLSVLFSQLTFISLLVCWSLLDLGPVSSFCLNDSHASPHRLSSRKNKPIKPTHAHLMCLHVIQMTFRCSEKNIACVASVNR